MGDAVLRRTRSALASRLHRVLPPGPVLDVGAGDGTLVGAFQRHGRAAIGVDPYASAHSPHVRAVEFEEMAGAWSAVIFWHSLEHLRRPVLALRHAAALVVPGGVLVVAVPNAASLQARLFGDRWLALDLPRHLVHISPQALMSQIEALGFRVERVSYLRGGQVLFGWLHGIVGRLPGHPDLYDAIRCGAARQAAQRPAFRLYALAAAVAALPLALAGTVIEVAARASGTIYVEARRLDLAGHRNRPHGRRQRNRQAGIRTDALGNAIRSAHGAKPPRHQRGGARRRLLAARRRAAAAVLSVGARTRSGPARAVRAGDLPRRLHPRVRARPCHRLGRTQGGAEVR
jgi:SAM-dependent methyltransferase